MTTLTAEIRETPRHPLIIGAPEKTSDKETLLRSLKESEIVPLGIYVRVVCRNQRDLIITGKKGDTGTKLNGVLNWATHLEDKPLIMVRIHEVGSEWATECADLVISLLYRKGKGIRFIIASADPAVIAYTKGLYRDVETALILRDESEEVLRSMPLKGWEELGYRHLVIEKLTGEENSDGLAELASYAMMSHGVQVWVITDNLIAFAAELVDKKVGVISECPVQIAQCALSID